VFGAPKARHTRTRAPDTDRNRKQRLQTMGVCRIAGRHQFFGHTVQLNWTVTYAYVATPTDPGGCRSGRSLAVMYSYGPRSGCLVPLNETCSPQTTLGPARGRAPKALYVTVQCVQFQSGTGSNIELRIVIGKTRNGRGQSPRERGQMMRNKRRIQITTSPCSATPCRRARCWSRPSRSGGSCRPAARRLRCSAMRRL
jgi:hypothetical protein